MKKSRFSESRSRQVGEGTAELSPNLGDGLRVQAAAVWDWEAAGLAATSIPFGEPDTLNELGQLVVAIEPAPAFLRCIDELEHHGERCLVREAALRADRAVAHGGEGALDRVRDPQVFPVFGREIVECEVGLAILRQTLGGLIVFQLVGCDEGADAAWVCPSLRESIYRLTWRSVTRLPDIQCSPAIAGEH
jgi:hypothetical protein